MVIRYFLLENNEKITGLVDGTDIINSEDNSLFIGSPSNHSIHLKKKASGSWVKKKKWRFIQCQIQTWRYKSGQPERRHTDRCRDRTVIGSAVPKWMGGFENTFSYKILI